METGSTDLRKAVREAYGKAAQTPGRVHPFPVGRELALDLGYPESHLEQVPPSCVERFAGVSNVSLFAEIPPDSQVLDLGCGAGLDSILVARRSDLQVIGVDFSKSMVEKARSAITGMDLNNLKFLRAEAEDLPFPDGSFEVVLANGIFNLNPERTAIFYEIRRILRNGGQFFGAELILKEPLSQETRADPDNWFR